MIGKTPWDVFAYLFILDGAAEAQARLLSALLETLPTTLLGMAAGIGFAFGLAVTSRLAPAFTRAFLPVALVTQTMPLVVLTPLRQRPVVRGVLQDRPGGRGPHLSAPGDAPVAFGAQGGGRHDSPRHIGKSQSHRPEPQKSRSHLFLFQTS